MMAAELADLPATIAGSQVPPADYDSDSGYRKRDARAEIEPIPHGSTTFGQCPYRFRNLLERSFNRLEHSGLFEQRASINSPLSS